MIAYELRDSFAGTVEQVLTVDENGDAVDTVTVPLFTGGVLRAGDADLNIAELLEAGDGRIVLDDATLEGQQAINVLDTYPPLKRVAAGDAEATVDPFAGAKAGELRERATMLGLEVEAGTKRDELAKGLAEQAHRAGAGDELVVPSDTRTVRILKDGSLAVESTTNPEA